MTVFPYTWREPADCIPPRDVRPTPDNEHDCTDDCLCWL